MRTIGKILVVEDDAAMNAILGDFLKKQGYAVTTATSATKALKILGASPPGKQPDLVLSDIKLGAISGIELTKRIRSEHPTVPVILFSIFDHLEKEAVAVGAKRFIKKPFPLESLARILTEELKNKPMG